MGEKNMAWEYDSASGQFYYVEGCKKFKIQSLMVLANGIGDLCFVVGKSGEPTVKKIVDAKKDGLQILGYPDCDIGIVMFADVGPTGKKLLMFDINPTVKPMIDFMISHSEHIHHGVDFEMYGGNNYTYT